jgi:hypothetical protein
LAKILGWGRAQSLFKHGNEGARAVVSGFQGGACNFAPFSQQLNRMRKTHLLPPSTKRKSCFFPKESLDRSLARAA